LPESAGRRVVFLRRDDQLHSSGLYALLGTCAYLLRTFEEQMNSRTFLPSEANSARFLIAAIGGAVVGLFNNFTMAQGASLSPLLCLPGGLCGGCVLCFLEGLLQDVYPQHPRCPGGCEEQTACGLTAKIPTVA